MYEQEILIPSRIYVNFLSTQTSILYNQKKARETVGLADATIILSLVYVYQRIVSYKQNAQVSKLAFATLQFLLSYLIIIIKLFKNFKQNNPAVEQSNIK